MTSPTSTDELQIGGWLLLPRAVMGTRGGPFPQSDRDRPKPRSPHVGLRAATDLARSGAKRVRPTITAPLLEPAIEEAEAMRNVRNARGLLTEIVQSNLMVRLAGQAESNHA
jgi:hypothetical protein